MNRDLREYPEQRLAASSAVQWAVRAVELVHAAAGSSANFAANPLESIGVLDKG